MIESSSVDSYRRRLQVEGSALAAYGAVATAAVLTFGPGATNGPASTAVQLVIVAMLMATFGVRSVRRALAGAEVYEDEVGSGEPTSTWTLAGIVVGLTLGFGFGAGWDAGLRVGGGCIIVGLAQALLFEWIVAREERRTNQSFHRKPGSSLFTGTRLGAR